MNEQAKIVVSALRQWGSKKNNLQQWLKRNEAYWEIMWRMRMRMRALTNSFSERSACKILVKKQVGPMVVVVQRTLSMRDNCGGDSEDIINEQCFREYSNGKYSTPINFGTTLNHSYNNQANNRMHNVQW